MTRFSLLSLAAGAAFALSAVAQDPPKVDPPKVDPAKAEEPPKADPPKSDPVAKPADDLVVVKTSGGDVSGTVSKVSATQISVKVPQQVQDGVTTQSVRVPNPVKPGHAQTYHTVKQQAPKYKTVQQEATFDLGATVAVKTASGRVSDMSAVQAGTSVVVHLTKVKEGKAYEKAEVHVEVTRILVPNQAAPPTGDSPKKN